MPVILGWALLALGGLAGAVFVGGEFAPHHQTFEPYLSDLQIIPAYAIAAFLFWRRPKHRVSHRLLVVGVSPVVALGLGEVLSMLWLIEGPEPWDWLLVFANQVAGLADLAAAVALLAVFPDGLYQRRYERWIVIAVTVQVFALPMLLLLCFPTLQHDPFMVWANLPIKSPIFLPSLARLQDAANAYYNSVFVWGSLAAAAILALRFRRLSHELRLQVKWPLLAAICFAGAILVGVLHQVGVVPSWLNQAIWYVTQQLFPLSVAIAMLKYRLLDIDVVIRKSLVYGGLWLAILGGYLGLSWALGLAVKQRLPIELAILLTIAVTIAFQPARRWLEGLADRRVFGERLSAYQALRKLGNALETNVDPAALGPQLAANIRAALGLRWVRISGVRPAGGKVTLQPIGWDGIAPGDAAVAELVVPLEHGKELTGVIECGPKKEGALELKDRDLLTALGRQAALALRNARLAADLTDQLELIRIQAHELKASRARIVQAQDDERRRMQRDLHDGVQQHLVTLAAKLRRAAVTGDGDMKGAVQGLAGDAEEAVFALQDFSNGIYPSVLSDEGLPAALWTHAQRLPVTVDLDVAPNVVGRRFDRESEAALYFVALEAIVNAQKHGRADRINVSLSHQGSDLRLEIADSGRGMAAGQDGRVGLGLTNMRDRVAALGGALEMESSPGHGTRVIATAPLGAEVRDPVETPEGRSALPTPVD